MRRAPIALAIAILPSMISSTAGADFVQSLSSPGPLAKPHAKLDDKCDSCHVPFKGIPSSACLACHDGTRARIERNVGPHAQWEKQGKKCSECHKDHKGRDHQLVPAVEKSFDHGTAAFRLTGKHGSVACEKCHTQGAFGPRWVGLAQDCIGCHADFHKGGFGPKCGTCHATSGWKPTTRTLADHIVPLDGKHAKLGCADCHKAGTHLAAQSTCGDCHEQKHGGTKAPCVKCHNTRDWKSATFQHDFCTCILPGKHQTAPCLGCHPKFVFTPTPLACAGCHTKDLKHEPLGACSRCHSALTWKTRKFDHDDARVGFKLDGKHLEAACENCHKKKGIFSGAPRACEGCHAVPAHGDFGACSKCHATAGWKQTSFSHDKTRFPLDGKHATVACQDCHTFHDTKQWKPGPNGCVLCHDNPHGQQFGARETKTDQRSVFSDQRSVFSDRRSVLLAANGPLVAANTPAPQPHVTSPKLGCTDCHDSKAWKPSTVTVAKHATYSYPLRGAHEEVRCVRCHDKGVFVGTPSRCAACHVDRHRGKLGAACERCHDESDFEHHPSFDHFAATGFPLEASHAKVPCAGCHGEGHSRALPDKPGCRTCHTPAHGDQFGSWCTKCHQPTRFADVPAFDHAQTMFPLERRHRAIRCTACHDGRKPKPEPECRSCHGDPHRGRTLLDCGECHRADDWLLVRFDHDRTEFPLRGAHFIVACRNCHQNDQYTGTRPECMSCHRGKRQEADMKHIDHRANTWDCGQCHTAFHW